MARPVGQGRLLPANVKVIEKEIATCSGSEGSPLEFRIGGVRGLVLHVMPSGTATWYVHYDMRVGATRKRRKHKIGRFDEVSLADAKDEAERLRPLIRKGADPVARQAADREAITFGTLAEDRLKRGDALRPATESDYRLVLKRDVLPALGPVPAHAVTREQVIAVLDAIADRGATRRADTAKAVISSVFRHGEDRGLVQQNPARGLRNRHDNQPREVVAGREDIRLLWRALESGAAAMSESIATIVRLALLTGLRRTEIAAALKEELDLDADAPTLTIGRGRAKNRNAHRVPLSPQAEALFRLALANSGDGRHIFPGSDGRPHIGSRSVSKAMERMRAKLGIKDITIHDLRRTAGTYLSQLGVPRDVRGRILNHEGKRQGNVTDAVYNRYEYEAEKRAALELWADALDCIVEGEKSEVDGYLVRLGRLKGADRIRI